MMIDPSYVPVVTSLISSVTTAGLTMGGWIMASKKTKKDEKKEIIDTLTNHKDETNQKILTIQKSVDNLANDFGKYQELMQVKFDTLTDRVEKHNNVIERTYALEKDMDVMKERVSVANHRINDLEDLKREA